MKNRLKIMNEIVAFLRDKKIEFSHFSDDGRINSAVNERKIVEILMSEIPAIKDTKKRDWFDICYENGDVFMPINIKITALSTDNLNCKLGIYYALTGKIPNFDNEISWENFLYNLRLNLAQNDEDYYFLIINKANLGDIFWTSLKQISSLMPNGNNLPFQANWAKNRDLNRRNYEKVKDFLMINLGKSLKLRANAYESFLENFPEFKGEI